MEVEIISTESIKPSSPTPIHLRRYNFSLLDHLIPSAYAPIVLFYPLNDRIIHVEVSKRLVLLKRSLSGTLTRFYPLAGKIKGHAFIDCNDDGAYYVEASVNCDLYDFLRQPDIMLINKFLPCEPTLKELTEDICVTNIQVNIFRCGGIAIGVCISHRILDGAALRAFLKGWADTACGNPEVVCPSFTATSLAPREDFGIRNSFLAMWSSFSRKGKFVTRRLVFAPSAIETLKTKGISFLVQNPSRVEAVSAFLWKCTMEASKKQHGYQRPSMLSHAVNLRRRTLPALPDNSIGNIIWMATAQCEMGTALDLSGLVAKTSKGISKVNGEFTKRLLSNKGCDVICEFLQETCEFSSKDSIMYIGYTSWCKLGLYDIDFGWGKPIWVSSMGLSTSVFVNLIILMETSCGDGIEAWITLDEQEMAVLEGDPELLKFACFDLSPLDFNHADNEALYL